MLKFRGGDEVTVDENYGVVVKFRDGDEFGGGDDKVYVDED